MFALFSTIASIILTIVDLSLGTVYGLTEIGLLSTLYSLAVLLPSLGVSVRRLHDTNHSGWWMFIVLIPLIGVLFLLVVMCFDSTEDNEYGPNPKTLNDNDSGNNGTVEA